MTNNGNGKRQYRTPVEEKVQAFLRSQAPQWFTRRVICERYARDYVKVGNILDQLSDDGILEKRDYRKDGDRGAKRFEYRFKIAQG